MVMKVKLEWHPVGVELKRGPFLCQIPAGILLVEDGQYWLW